MWIKSCLLSVLSVTAFGVASLPAGAQQATTQVSNQTAAIVGDNNTINQYNIQLTTQQKLRNAAKKTAPQNAVQVSDQTAGIVGSGNQIIQENQQITVQQRVDKHKPNHRGRALGRNK